MALDPLASLAEFKAYKSLTSTTKDVAHLDALNKASDIIRAYCATEFNNGDLRTQYFKGDQSFYYLEESPVIAIVSINSSTDNQVTQTLLVENTDYYVDKDSGTIETINGLDFYTSPKFRFLEVKFVANLETIPEDLKLAAINLADYYIDEGYLPRKSTGVHSKDAPNEKFAFPYYIKGTLDIYRNISI